MYRYAVPRYVTLEMIPSIVLAPFPNLIRSGRIVRHVALLLFWEHVSSTPCTKNLLFSLI
jgi:hypothetical protein